MDEWPRECVGYVVGAAYEPQINVARNPTHEFSVADSAWHDGVRAVIHSHAVLGNLGPEREDRAPSRADMAAQISAAVPFGIVACDSRATTSILWFGDHVLEEPLLGRTFVQGVRDCYELARAYFWQRRRIKLKGVPRDADWWEDPGQDLIMDGFRSAGFSHVGTDDARPGDGLLLAPFSGKVNHCAVLTEAGLMMHHRGGKLSNEEPWSDAWRRVTRAVVRYRG